jgi:hypothetical protein
MRLHRRARAIRGQIERARRAREVILPVGDLAIEGLAGEPGALPLGVVGVLDRQLGERRGAARDEGAVERADLAEEDAVRPAVGGDVVHRKEEHVIGVREAEQAGAEHRPSGEIEGAT